MPQLEQPNIALHSYAGSGFDCVFVGYLPSSELCRYAARVIG